MEEANLLRARRLARENQWWTLVVSCMQGLVILYEYQGRFAEYARLVEDVRLEFCTVDYEPVKDREEDYLVVMGYLVSLATRYEFDSTKAITLQKKLSEYCRKKAARIIELASDTPLDRTQHYLLHTFAVSLSELATLKKRAGDSACILDYKEAIATYERVGSRSSEAVTQWNLGNAYKDLPDVRDLNAAESAYSRSMDLLEPQDNWGRSKCVEQIGMVHFERFEEARERGESPETIVAHFLKAEQCYQEALELCPKDALNELAAIHGDLGGLYLSVSQYGAARKHFEEGLKVAEAVGDRYGTGLSRISIAFTYSFESATGDQNQRANLVRAVAYAEAALRDFKYYGGRAAKEERNAQDLIDQINHRLGK